MESDLLLAPIIRITWAWEVSGKNNICFRAWLTLNRGATITQQQFGDASVTQQMSQGKHDLFTVSIPQQNLYHYLASGIYRLHQFLRTHQFDIADGF